MLNFKVIPLRLPDLSISVERIRRSLKPGPTLAYADLRVGPVIICGISIVKNKTGEGLFVALPFTQGSVRKFPIIELDEEIKTQAFRLILEAWKEFSKQ